MRNEMLFCRNFSCALLALAFMFGAAPSMAGLFSDDEAHRKIAVQQQHLDEMQKSVDARLTSIENTIKSQGLVDLLNQLEALRAEVAKLRGQIEVQTYEIETTQKRQKDLYVDLDTRLRKFEAAGGSSAALVPGTTVSPAPAKAAVPPTGAAKSGSVAKVDPVADPKLANAAPAAADPLAESRAYEAAYNLFRTGNYQGAINSFQSFLQTYPSSQFGARAQYWIGNSHYALQDYKAAINDQQTLITTYPGNQKIPDAMLNLASAQAELGDAAASKKILEEIVAKYPISDAAEKAKRRLRTIK